MATQTRIISLYSKTKDYCFLTIRRVYHPFFFKTWYYLAIKLYCFKLLFKHHFCLNNRPFAFSITDNNFDSSCHSNKILNEAKFLCQVLTASKDSNKSNRRLLRYCTFIFSLSCSIASVTSYLIENEAENLQNGDVHLAQIPDFEMEYLENHLAHWGRWWLVFFTFFTLFHLSLTFFPTGGSLQSQTLKMRQVEDESWYIFVAWENLTLWQCFKISKSRWDLGGGGGGGQYEHNKQIWVWLLGREQNTLPHSDFLILFVTKVCYNGP